MGAPAPLPVVVDADVGIDDAIALAFLAARPDVELVAVGAVQGNCAASTAARNGLRVLEAVEIADVPVAVGAERPLAGNPRPRPEVHGGDGLGDCGLPPPALAPTAEDAADQIARLGRERPGELALLALGPLTNLALALGRDGDALAHYRSVHATGGPLPRSGHAVSTDVNTANDPEAARRVLTAAGRRITLVGVGVARATLLDEPAIAAIEAAATPHARLATRVLSTYLDHYERRLSRRACQLHDPTTAAVLVDSSLVAAIAADPASDATVVTAVDGGRVRDELVDTLLGRGEPAGSP